MACGERPWRSIPAGYDHDPSPATAAALKVLAEHGLAEHGSHGWRRGPVTLTAATDKCGATRQHKEREAAYAADRAVWQALIASWLAPPAFVGHDDGPIIAIDDILEHLEPPGWLAVDSGPPAAHARMPAQASRP